MSATLPVLYRLQLAPGRVPIRFRLLLAFTLPLAIWILVSVLNIAAWNHAVQNSERLLDSQRMILFANQYSNASLRAQASKRGYLMTSNPDFLGPFRDAADEAMRVHAQLRELNAAEPEQLARLENAGNLFQEWLHDVAWRLVELRRGVPLELVRETEQLEKTLLRMQDMHIRATGGGNLNSSLLATVRAATQRLMEHDALAGSRAQLRDALQDIDAYQQAAGAGDWDSAAVSMRDAIAQLTRVVQQVNDVDAVLQAELARGEGHALLDRFHSEMDEFIATENRRLRQYQQEMARADERGRLLLWVGPAIGLLLMIFITNWMSRRISRALEGISRAARGLARGELGARAAVRGSDEFAVLAQRFNSMAELVENRSRESAALAELGELLQSSTSIDEAARIFAELAGKLFPGQPGALYLVSPSRDEVRVATSWCGGERFSQTEFMPDDCWALRLSRAHENGAGNAVECAHLLSDERGSVCLPLHAFGESIGVLFVTLKSGAEPDHIDEEQRRGFLETVAEQLALALANLRMRETLRNQSIRDPLTQLYNRRYLDETFRRELHRAARRDAPLAVLTFDIDHFKRFNDTHGHDGGDALLKAVGNSLRDFFRAEDGAFRSGGEEFVAILPETALEDALARAEDLRREIASLEVQHGNLLLPPVTISVGVACFPQHGKTTQMLLKAADRALYKAKEAGRNCVMAAE